MHKLIGFRILAAPVDDCSYPDIDEKSRQAKVKEALKSIEIELMKLVNNGYQILGFGQMPTVIQTENELS